MLKLSFLRVLLVITTVLDIAAFLRILLLSIQLLVLLFLQFGRPHSNFAAFLIQEQIKTFGEKFERYSTVGMLLPRIVTFYNFASRKVFQNDTVVRFVSFLSTWSKSFYELFVQIGFWKLKFVTNAMFKLDSVC